MHESRIKEIAMRFLMNGGGSHCKKYEGNVIRIKKKKVKTVY